MVREAPALSDGGLHLPDTPGGLHHYEPPLTCAACKARTLDDAEDGRLTDPKKIAMKLHAHWGHASAQPLTRVLLDSERNYAH